MLIAEAQVTTDRPSRYLVQLCRHLSNKGQHLSKGRSPHGGHQAPAGARIEWSERDGLVELGWARCVLRAEDGRLVLRAEAADASGLQRMQQLIGGHLARFSRRDELEVTWLPHAPTRVEPA